MRLKRDGVELESLAALQQRLWSRRSLLGGGLVTVAAVAAPGCVPDGRTGGAGSGELDHSVLELALSSEPGSWDPAMQVSAGDQRWRWMAVYDTLLVARPGGEIAPGAAESFEFSDDSRTLTMQLRSGMTFADGQSVDSKAAKASIENMRDGGGTGAGRVAGVTVEAPDDLTVVLTSPEPRGLLPVIMTFSMGIVASPKALKSSDVDSRPVSSGPYELDLENTTSGSVYTYVKRDDYWNADDYPYQTLVLTVMGDATARVNALRTEQVHGANLTQPTAKQAEASEVAVTQHVNAWAGLYIMDRNGQHIPALGDVRVRRAMNMVFNRPEIAKGLYQGEAQPTTQIFHPNSTAYVKELDSYFDFDVAGAKQLMAEAGFADGFEVTIPAISPTTDQANPLIVQQLSKINITVQEKSLSGPTAINEVLSGKFQVVFWPIGMADPLFDVESSLLPDAVWNTSQATDPRLNKLVAKAQVATGEEADKTFQAISRFCVEEAWFVPWVYVYHYFGLDTRDRLDENTDYFQTNPHLWDFQ